MMKDIYLEKEANIFKALGHISRLGMVKALMDGEKCVCELQSLVGSDLSTISKHLSVLKNAGVVKSEKRSNSVYYQLALPCLGKILCCIEGCSNQKCSNSNTEK